MKNQERSTLLRPHFVALGAIFACLFSVTSFAATPASGAGQSSLSDIQAQYKQDMAACQAGQTNQDMKTCKREAGAALEAARQHRLDNGQADTLEKNATMRCQALPGDQRADCMMQMADQNTVIKGSVGSGGILRETTITEPAPPDSTMPAMPAMPESPNAPRLVNPIK